MTSAQQSGSDSERERLKQQLRQRLGLRRTTPGPAAALPGGGAAAAGRAVGLAARQPVALGELVPGSAQEAHHGTAYVVRRPVAGLSGGRQLEDRFVAAMANPESPLRRRLCAAGYAGESALPDCILLDIETAGLGNVPIFLVGSISWTGLGLEAVQFLARDYAEEGPALALWQAQAQDRGLLITFNGKSFDLPCVRSRTEPESAAGHLGPLPCGPAARVPPCLG